MKKIELIVAVRDEEENIPTFAERVKELATDDVKIYILFTEDGSKDNTVEILRKLAKEDKSINYLSLDNKYGQYAALTYALMQTEADAVITMDADGGHPIEVVKEMIKEYGKSCNVVQGVRKSYKRKRIYRSAASVLYNILFSALTGVNMFKQNVMFRLLDKKAKEEFLKNKSWWHIFKTNFNKRDNIKTRYVYYDAPERNAGESKYNLIKLIKLSYKSFFSLITIRRFSLLNMILVLVIIGTIYLNLHSATALLSVIFIVEIISFISIRTSYPILKLKVNETTLKRI